MRRELCVTVMLEILIRNASHPFVFLVELKRVQKVIMCGSVTQVKFFLMALAHIRMINVALLIL